MSQYGERIGHDTVRFTRTLPGPIERVWEYLVDGEKRAEWFCAGTTGRAAGDEIELVFEHRTLSSIPDDDPPEKYAHYGERTTSRARVTRAEKPRVFAFLWYGRDEESEVTYELAEKDDQVELVLTHRRLRTREDVIGVLGGWHAHLDILEDVLSERVPEPFWRRFNPLDAHYDSIIEPLQD